MQAQTIFSWSDESFKTIIERTIIDEEGITDISAPPGARKTLNVIRFILERGLDAIMSFPNHQNQLTALNYILSSLESMGFLRLRHFIIDYAGIENYCIFYRPELLAKLLDKFKESPDDTYRDAVDNMLYTETFFWALNARGTTNVEEIWYRIADALEQYKKNKDLKTYISVIKNIVEKKGQHEICTNVCPVGLFAWWMRKELYKFLSEPKIITWRRLKDRALPGRIPVVHANPENFVENIEKLIRGEFSPEWVLCPRLLLIMKLSLSRKSKQPVYVPVRRSIILTPHAGLEFVVSVVRREEEVSRAKRKRILFIDEYDSMFAKPVYWPLVSLEDLKTIISISDMIKSAGIGETVHGEYVDNYLKRYAEYVNEVASSVLRIVESATNTRNYHPLVNVFVEGAFSVYYEKTLRTKTEVVYRPLGPRIVHIKHFLADDKGRLLSLILNPKQYFSDYAEADRDWEIRYRESVMKFRSILSRTKTLANEPMLTRIKGDRVLRLVRRERSTLDVLRILNEFLSPLIMAPRYAVFYAGGPKKRRYIIRLASIDVRLYQLLTWSRFAVLTSATPIWFHAYVAGPNADAFSASEYERVVTDISHSLVYFDPPSILVYEDRVETRFTAHFMIYTKDFKRKLTEAIRTGQPIEFRNATTRIEVPINQISPKISRVKEYISLIRLHFFPTLAPLRVKPGDEYIEALKEYLHVLAMLLYRGKTVLVLVQNKKTAEIVSRIAGARPVPGDGSKITHYVRGRLAITYFRSRGTRGIDLPIKQIDAVVVIGSPYPRPSVFAHYRSDSGLSPFSTRLYIPYTVIGYNTGPEQVVKTLVPRDFMAGISELAQSIGRATRIAMKTSRHVTVILPQFIAPRLLAYSPYWLRLATKGL